MVTRFHALALAALAGASLVSGAAFAQSCTPTHKIDQLVSPGKLTVAMYEYPPFSVTNGGEIGGVDGEMVKSIAKSACLTLAPVVVDPAATIQYVISGKADIAGGDWYRTAERAKVLGLSYPTYLDQMGIYSKDGVSTVAAMVGKQVGTVSGFLWVTDLQKLLGTNLHLYPNPVALAQDLQAGRIQIGVDSYGTGAYAQKKGGYPGIIIKVAEPDPRVRASAEAAQANLLYTKGNASLGAAMDADIEEMHKDGLIAKYLGSFGLDPSGADPRAAHPRRSRPPHTAACVRCDCTVRGLHTRWHRGLRHRPRAAPQPRHADRRPAHASLDPACARPAQARSRRADSDRWCTSRAQPAPAHATYAQGPAPIARAFMSAVVIPLHRLGQRRPSFLRLGVGVTGIARIAGLVGIARQQRQLVFVGFAARAAAGVGAIDRFRCETLL